jgi:hypothetical protein
MKNIVYINGHKALVAVVLGLMWFYDNWGPEAFIYLSIHVIALAPFLDPCRLGFRFLCQKHAHQGPISVSVSTIRGIQETDRPVVSKAFSNRQVINWPCSPQVPIEN